MLKTVIIYTDGACSGNPGVGGYCGILEYKGRELVVKGAEKETTNNKMELSAVIQSLKRLKEKCNVEIYSDSAYVVNAINEKWLDSWKEKNWKTISNKEVKNLDLWKELDNLISYHQVKFIKVKGHADNEKNNRCDEIARKEITNLTNNG